ncbi:MAG TPA: DUF2283 domain-containing protein [Verrucomicrobiae bacterium]|nr:DUF2283 domain-containing protein [Verrucomicrobiae bacterium]
MKLTCDPRHNIAYLRLHEKTGAVETIHVSDEVNVDIAPDGTVYGVELLNANEQLRGEDHGKLVVVNEARHDRAELPLDVRNPPAVVREKPKKKYGK